MNKTLLGTLTLASAALLSGGNAHAARLISCGGSSGGGGGAPGECSQTSEGVVVTTASNATLVNGSTQQTNAPVQFTSTTDRLNAAPNAQVFGRTISAVSAVDQALNQLTFSLTGFTFQTAQFNFFNGLTSPLTVILSTNTGSQQTFGIANSSGLNRFAVAAVPGETLTSVSFTSTSGFGSFGELRLTGVMATAAVPEPATWAMMIGGFGMVGGAMRSARRTRKVTASYA